MNIRPDPMPALARLAEVQGRADAAHALFVALDEALGAVVGHILCSIQVHQPSLDQAERVYSNQPALYPVGARKQAAGAPRMRELMRTGRPVLVRNAEEFRRSYPDHAGVSSLGCGSAVNTPVRWQGRTLGQVNLMHREGWYAEADLSVIRVFAQVLVPTFLALQAQAAGREGG